MASYRMQRDTNHCYLGAVEFSFIDITDIFLLYEKVVFLYILIYLYINSHPSNTPIELYETSHTFCLSNSKDIISGNQFWIYNEYLVYIDSDCGNVQESKFEIIY